MNAAALTKSQHRVLAFLAGSVNEGGRVQVSTRALAAALTMSRRTVQAAIDMLNAEGFIRTWAGSRIEASEHTVLFQFTLDPVPPDRGAIGTVACGKDAVGGGAIETDPGAIAPTNPHVPGAITPRIPQPLYKERACACASDTHSLTDVLSEEDLRRNKWVSEFLGSDGAEIVDFVEIGLSEHFEQSAPIGLHTTTRAVALDSLTRARFVALPRELGLSPADVAKRIGAKLADLHRRKFRCDHPRVLLDFVVDQVHKDRDPAGATRKPPAWEYGRATMAAGAGR